LCELEKGRHYLGRESDQRMAEAVTTAENQRLKVFSAVEVPPKDFD